MERFLMILEDGPYPDEYKAPKGLTWPLPEYILAEGHIDGVYRKVFESKGKATVKDGKIQLRGARYEWDETISLFDIAL